MEQSNDWERQIDTIIRMLEGKHFEVKHKTFEQLLTWLQHPQLPHQVREPKRRKLLEVACATYKLTEQQLYAHMAGLELQNGHKPTLNEEELLERELPRGGWFEWYADYTRQTESPLSYHIFSSLCVLGAAVGRRIYKPKGFFNIYGNYVAVLVGPPARVAKTSAVDIARGLIEEAALCPIMADKITPEAIANSLTKSGHHFIYAPEFSVFFGKQKYNEGLLTLMLRMLDSPDKWKVETMGRGEEVVTNVAITLLGGSTMSLLASATPEQATSSGFLSRCVLVVESDSSREFSEPKRGPDRLRAALLQTALRLRDMAGEMSFDGAAQQWFDDRYHNWKQMLKSVDNEMTAEILSRGMVHLERTAMLIHLAHCDTFTICERCLKAAGALMEYVNKRVPFTVSALSQTQKSAEVEFVMDALRRMGGAADHSQLLRRVSSRMNAQAFRGNIATLIEAKLVRQEKRGLVNFYIMEAQ